MIPCSRPRLVLIAVVAVLLCGLQAEAGPVDLVSHQCGGSLTNGADYEWWYGCAPTSAGMMMGYYDRNGYAGLRYDNLVPGGVAESSTFGNPDALVNAVIASSRHISDYYRDGDGASGDDVPGAPTGPLDCLADFMGTSQDSYLGYPLNNTNGSTTFYFYADGSALTYIDIYRDGPAKYHDSGMYGIYEYVEYAGYQVEKLYNQYTDNLGLTYGFTFEDYKAEIDAGRPVLIHLEGHAMFAYGYEDSNVVFNDTWNPGPHTMEWGGSYDGLSMYGVTVLELAGGTAVPEPSALVVGLLSMVPLGLTLFWRHRREDLGSGRD